jgi:hypothetical protein
MNPTVEIFSSEREKLLFKWEKNFPAKIENKVLDLIMALPPNYNHFDCNKNDNQFCNICGRSVKLGSGWFVNRVHDLNNAITRQEMGRKFPTGDFVCVECDNKISDDF